MTHYTKGGAKAVLDLLSFEFNFENTWLFGCREEALTPEC